MDGFQDWKWNAGHVNTSIDNGEHVSAEFSIIMSGPSRLSHLGTATVGGSDTDAGTGTQRLTLIGLVQSFRQSQNRQVTRLFEIGARRSYFVPQRVFAQFDISRVLFFGPSLMRFFYAHAPKEVVQAYGGSEMVNGASGSVPETPAEYLALFPTAAQIAASQGIPAGANVSSSDNAGANRDYWISLAAGIFHIPVGLCHVERDARERAYGATYLEDVYIEGHSKSSTAQDVIVAEGVNGVFDIAMPVQV
jgi:hypothetical protein